MRLLLALPMLSLAACGQGDVERAEERVDAALEKLEARYEDRADALDAQAPGEIDRTALADGEEADRLIEEQRDLGERADAARDESEIAALQLDVAAAEAAYNEAARAYNATIMELPNALGAKVAGEGQPLPTLDTVGENDIPEFTLEPEE